MTLKAAIAVKRYAANSPQKALVRSAAQIRQCPVALAAAAMRIERHSCEPAVMRPSGSSMTSGRVSSTPAPSTMCATRQS